jgi:hypothetical protein
MEPTQSLPEAYHPIGTFDLAKNFRLLVWMNVLGLGIYILSGLFFIQILHWLRPASAGPALASGLAGLQNILQTLVGLVILYAAVILLHEGLHGVCFWLFIRQRPVFAFKGAYAYAAAPDWFLPRNKYFITAVAPLVGISLLGGAAFAFVPPTWFLPVLAGLIINAGGAASDLWVAAWLLRQPPSCYANDRGDAITLYLAGEAEPGDQ